MSLSELRRITWKHTYRLMRMGFIPKLKGM